MSAQSNNCSFGTEILKILAVLSLVMIVLTAVLGFQTVEVQDGYEVVVIDKPWLFGQEGIREGTFKSGRVTVSASSKVIQINMQPQYAELVAENTRSKDSLDRAHDTFAAKVNFRYQFTDAKAYAMRGDPYWFTDRMDFVFRDRVIQEYAGFTRAEINDFMSFSPKINANLVTGFNDELRKAGIPVQVLDVRVSSQPLRL